MLLAVHGLWGAWSKSLPKVRDPPQNLLTEQNEHKQKRLVMRPYKVSGCGDFGGNESRELAANEGGQHDELWWSNGTTSGRVGEQCVSICYFPTVTHTCGSSNSVSVSHSVLMDRVNVGQ